MKKWVIVVLVLLLAGCIPRIEDISSFSREKKQEIIRGRGLSVDFIEPRFRIKDGEKTLRVGDEFNVVVGLSHNLKYRDVSGDIYLTSTSSKGEKIFSSAGFFVSKAEVEQDKVKYGEDVVELGSFMYGEKMRKEVDSLNLKINSRYDGLVISELCFDSDERIFGCANDETISGGKLAGDNNALPVAIEKIEKWVSDFESDGVDFDLIIYLKNYGSGSIEGEIGSFVVDMRDGSISCNDVVLKDDRWKVECEGSKIYGKSPITFEFDYTYVTNKVVAFRVV